MRGQKARRVIENMGYRTDELQAAVRGEVEVARGEGRLGAEEAGALLERYGHELVGYTYLEEV